MKKTTSSLLKLLLTLALVITALLPQRAEAATASLGGSGTVQAGSTVKLTLSVSGSGIMGVDATDPDQLSRAEMEGREQVQQIFRFLRANMCPAAKTPCCSARPRTSACAKHGTSRANIS